MLTRLETLYLGILRIVILVVATFALVIAAFGLIAGIPPLVRHFGYSHEEAKGGTLGDFVAQKRLTSATATSNETTTSDTTEPSVDKLVVENAAGIHAYLGKTDTFTAKQWQDALISTERPIPYDEINAYRNSIKSLVDQLKESTGKKLTGSQVAELIDWNSGKFTTNLQEKAANAAAETAKAYVTVSAAGAAFVIFILIAFAFLFVKIERSLRVVRTRSVEDHYA